MNHGELVIAFSLAWPVYLVLYVLVGLFSIIELIIFFIYHHLANRDQKAQFKIF